MQNIIKGSSGRFSCCGSVFGDRPSNIVEDVIEISSQVTEIRSGLVKKYIIDRANDPVNVKKSELEQ